MNKKRIAILGAGDLGRQIMNFIQLSEHYIFVGFFDDFCSQENVIDKFSSYANYYNIRYDELFVALGYKHLETKLNLTNEINKNNIPLANIIHSSCIIDPSAQIGSGNMFYPGCIIDKGVVIGSNNIFNLGVIISHDSKIDNCNFFAPNSTICGTSSIGSCNFIGANAVVIDNKTIGHSIIIGAGAVVINSISTKGTYVGSPAKFLK